MVPQLHAQVDKGHPTSLYSSYSEYGVEYTSTQPIPEPRPFYISAILDIWVHCGDMENGDKVYRTNLNLPMPTTQPSTYFYELAETYKGCDNFFIYKSHEGDMVGDVYRYDNFGDPNTSRTKIGKLTINQDINGVLTFNNGKKWLLITDKLPYHILLVREIN